MGGLCLSGGQAMTDCAIHRPCRLAVQPGGGRECWSPRLCLDSAAGEEREPLPHCRVWAARLQLGARVFCGLYGPCVGSAPAVLQGHEQGAQLGPDSVLSCPAQCILSWELCRETGLAAASRRAEDELCGESHGPTGSSRAPASSASTPMPHPPPGPGAPRHGASPAELGTSMGWLRKWQGRAEGQAHSSVQEFRCLSDAPGHCGSTRSLLRFGWAWKQGHPWLCPGRSCKCGQPFSRYGEGKTVCWTHSQYRYSPCFLPPAMTGSCTRDSNHFTHQ